MMDLPWRLVQDSTPDHPPPLPGVLYHCIHRRTPSHKVSSTAPTGCSSFPAVLHARQPTYANGGLLALLYHRQWLHIHLVSKMVITLLTFTFLTPLITGAMLSTSNSGSNITPKMTWQDHAHLLVHTSSNLRTSPAPMQNEINFSHSDNSSISHIVIHTSMVLSTLLRLMAGNVGIGFVRPIGTFYGPRLQCSTTSFHQSTFLPTPCMLMPMPIHRFLIPNCRRTFVALNVVMGHFLINHFTPDKRSRVSVIFTPFFYVGSPRGVMVSGSELSVKFLTQQQNPF